MSRGIYLTILVGLLVAALLYASQLFTSTQQGNVTIINMTTRNWRFDPIIVQGDATATVKSRSEVFADTVIKVRKGDTVMIRISNLEPNQPHGFSLAEFRVSEVIPPKETVTIRFVANKEGSYEFFCNVFCGSGHPRHRGTLIVS